MLRITIANNTDRNTVSVDENSTIRAALAENGVDYSGAIIHMDGSPISPGDIDKTFASLGYDGSDGHDKCFLTCVVKTNCAA